jgi:hypothetical protein
MMILPLQFLVATVDQTLPVEGNSVYISECHKVVNVRHSHLVIWILEIYKPCCVMFITCLWTWQTVFRMYKSLFFVPWFAVLEIISCVHPNLMCSRKDIL